MNKLLSCLSIFAYPSDSEDEEGDNQPGASVKAKDLESQKTSKKSDVEEKNKSLVEKCENNVDDEAPAPPVPANSNDSPDTADNDPEAIEVIAEDPPSDSQPVSKSKPKKTENNEEEEVNLKHERNKLVVTQIALAEESGRLRRKEKREKHRKEMSKWLGINAWKCDQKFLLNWGEQPEDIKERVIIIRKRNVKKERQRRIDEFVLRAEINAAAKQNLKKVKSMKK